MPKWQKGQSGNPGGRPKRKWTFAGLIEQELKKTLKTTKGGKIKARKAVIGKLIMLAVDGDLAAIKEIMNRLDGMPKQALDVTSGNEPLFSDEQVKRIADRLASRGRESGNTPSKK
jgi:ribosomal protein L17